MDRGYLERIVYLNGAFVKGREAKISAFDRGFLFADAVYEGLGILERKIVDRAKHWERLRSSLDKLEIDNPLNERSFDAICEGLIERNAIEEGFCYLQITRGVAERDYVCPEGIEPTVFAFARPHSAPVARADPKGLALISHPDWRWRRRDIKTTNLLGQVLAKTHAAREGGDEALLVDEEGFVTEGGYSSVFVIIGDRLIARPVTFEILNGVTRRTMLEATEELGLAIELRRFSLEEAKGAEEAFLTGASAYVEPIVSIDGRPIGSGAPGPRALAIRKAYLERIGAQ